MANIYSVKDGNEYHFDDPNAWQGGVVPGPSDFAYIDHQFTQINSGSGIHHWTGTVPSIRVDSTQYLSDSGSFYTYLTPGAQEVKIDYDSKDAYYLYSCSIDQSYQTWEPHDSGSYVGIIRNDSQVYSSPTTIYLSGSASWHVRGMSVRDAARFIMKDQATLYLDSTTGDSYVNVEDATFKALGEVTCAITGSTRRNSSFINVNGHNGQRVLVSGSSDPRSATKTSTTVSIGSSSIPVTDSSNFEKGDIISLYTIDDTRIQTTPHGNNLYDAQHFRETGSVFPYEWREKYKDEDDTVEVVGKSGNNLHIKKLFGKEGEVLESNNQETRGSFQRKHKKVSKKFTGLKTSITVRSGHNSFKAGDILSVNGNSYTVLEAASKLIPNKELDFSQGAGLEDFFIDEMIGSASLNDAYKVNSHMKSGSYLSQDYDEIGTQSYYRSFYLKGIRLRDAKITLSGSLFDESGSFSTNSMLGISFGDEVYVRDRVLPFYDRHEYARESFIGFYGDYLRYGRMSNDVSYVNVNTSDELASESPRTNSFTVSIDRLGDTTDYYLNDRFLSSYSSVNTISDIGLHFRYHLARASKLIVEEYVQVLLLDTSDSISVGSKIYEGGLLVDHPQSQSIVKIASTVRDMRGYRDLAAEYAQGNLSGSIVPLYWSNQGNYTYYRNSSTGNEYGRTDGMLKSHGHSYRFRTLSSGDQSFELNLGEQTTFDAIGISHEYAYNNAYLKGFGIEVSNDGHTWTVVKPQADDLRLGTFGAAGHRIHHITQTSAKFLRIRVNGGSASSNNYISKLSIYNFNNRGASVELSNASDFPVGSKLAFVYPNGHSNIGYSYHKSGGAINNYIGGSIDESDILGGPFTYYTVTARSGNVVTLDRHIENEYLTPDALVVKLDRPLKVTTAGRYPLGMIYGNTGNGVRSIEFYNVEALSLGNNSREQNYFYISTPAGRTAVINCAFNYLYPDSNATYQAGTSWKNNVTINSAHQNWTSYRYHSDQNVHGEISSAYYSSNHLGNGFGIWYTGNIFCADRRHQLNHISTLEAYSSKSVYRGNYILSKDYFINDIGQYRSGISSYLLDMYSNTINQNTGYNRWSPTAMDVFLSKNRVEFPQPYPPVKDNNFYYTGNTGMFNTRKVGSIQGESFLVPNDPLKGGKSHLSDADMRSITKRLDSNEFDVNAIHLRRHTPTIFRTTFDVSTAQEVRAYVTLDYYTDFFHQINQYNSSNSIIRLVLIGPNKRTITVRELPYQMEYGKFVFDHTFNALPGVHELALLKYTYPYGERILTYRDSNCIIKGEDPSNIQILYNGFLDHLLLLDPDKAKVSLPHKQGTVAFENNPNRTTVKFRKIKF